jgi:CubicO group peptidase (beta-lactamase class C family)
MRMTDGPFFRSKMMKLRSLVLPLVIILLVSIFAPGQTGPKLTEKQRFELAAEYSRRTRGLSVLVIKGDAVVFEEYQNGHAAGEPWVLFSGTKSFTGVMLAAAIEDKLIKDFDEKVSDTITEWKSDPRK